MDAKVVAEMPVGGAALVVLDEVTGILLKDFGERVAPAGESAGEVVVIEEAGVGSGVGPSGAAARTP